MAPASTVVCFQLKQLIYFHLDNNLLKNALFFAERLSACDSRSSDVVYLLSLCHLRLGDNASAYEYSRPVAIKGAHLGCVYTFAQACLALEKHKEGTSALEKSRGLWLGKSNFGKHTEKKREPYPDASVIHCLLGKLYQGHGDQKKAISNFEEALKLNPFMWDAFTSLCDMGTKLNVPNIFKMNPEMEDVLRSPSDPSEGQAQSKDKDMTLSATLDHVRNRTSTRTGTSVDLSGTLDPFNNVSSRNVNGGLFQNFSMSQKLNESNPSLTNIPAAGGGGIGPEAMATPTGPSASIDASAFNRKDPSINPAYILEPPQAPPRKTRTIPGIGINMGMDAKSQRPIVKKAHGHRFPNEGQVEESAAVHGLRSYDVQPGPIKRSASGQPRQPSEEPGPGQQRRSARLLNHMRPASTKSSSSSITVGSNSSRELKKARPAISKIVRPNSTASTVGRQVSGNRKPVPVDSMDIDEKEPAPNRLLNYLAPTAMQSRLLEQDKDSTKQEEGLRWLLDLFKKLGSGYFALSQFQCKDSLETYRSLEKKQQDTPWVLAQMGRAYYEQAAYSEAEYYYKRIRHIAPTRYADMEIYSTILWHLKRETDLTYLAHVLIDASWQSPQAWCAIGNAWSLTRDHEQALRSFKRATQLNPKFAYAFTLQGHEHVANEEYDKALSSYRQGIAADPRHYNAWYGVGRVYEKQGQYDKAFASFTRASRINPTNAVLICCIGTVLEKQKQPRLALEKFTRATEIAPKSALTRFKKARALMALGDMDTALRELMILKDLAPDEAMVHFLLGRLYKSLREKGAAVRHFTIALNLDPKASQQIKEAIESLEDEDEDEESSMMA
ncbi:hypothetical protein B0O99DRAFT_637966 [Bisporella sp. PMI_857]|nr:hypothetical protein B0O99DRAFT_637966 [Bisporella sp. PMI_857]